MIICNSGIVMGSLLHLLRLLKERLMWMIVHIRDVVISHRTLRSTTSCSPDSTGE